jgi:hypothetical protein
VDQVDAEKIERLATGPPEEIPYLDLSYEEWEALQHFWMLERLGLADDEPLAVCLKALDRIARRPVNGSGVDVYYIARSALERCGGWVRERDE